MKASELVELLQTEIGTFGDMDVVVFCPEHSGEHGNEAMAVHGIGWYGDERKNLRAAFIECAECHADGMNEKAWSDAMDEIDATIEGDGE